MVEANPMPVPVVSGSSLDWWFSLRRRIFSWFNNSHFDLDLTSGAQIWLAPNSTSESK